VVTESGVEQSSGAYSRSIATTMTESLPCWAEIDLSAVADNVASLSRWVKAGTVLGAVVKAQAYGTGARAIACTAIAAGARWLAVARVHEARELRDAGLHCPILVMTRTHPNDAEEAVDLNLTVTVENVGLARAVGASAMRRGRRAAIHVKVDTGLHRFGVRPNEALPLVRSLSLLDGVEVQGLYTHFASADEPDPAFTREQLECFLRVSNDLENAGYRFPVRHAANSAGTIAFREAHLDLVRVGLALYGVSPSGSLPDGLALHPAVSLRAHVARVVHLAAGEGVGYGQTWHASRPSQVALVTAGYADGVPRRLSNRGNVLLRGTRCPIVGRVSMDQTTIDVTNCGPITVGDVATFYGRYGAVELSLDEFAAAAETIPHEVLTTIGGRVPRVYVHNGEIGHIARLGETELLQNSS
jgi:alanine racemase